MKWVNATRLSDSLRQMTRREALVTRQKGTTAMASNAKKKTTMAKLARESRLRERRLDKQAKKDARKHAAAHDPEGPGDPLDTTTAEPAPTEAVQPHVETVPPASADA